MTHWLELRPALVGAFLMTTALLGLSASAEARQQASIVLDYDTSQVLHASSADTLAYPASLTKMMTLYLLFDALEERRLAVSSRLRVSARAAAMPPTKLGLRAGTTIAVEEAILGLVTKSANDAAAVVAEALGGSEADFANLMTRTARAMGMTRTAFANASGLPDADQRSTARDLARLAFRLIRDFPQYYSYFATETFRFRGRTHGNHNHLLGVYSGMDGLKTGYTRASGFNLAASAARDGRRLIAVVLGGRTAGSRDARMAQLLDAGFERIEDSRVLTAEVRVPVPRAESETAVASTADIDVPATREPYQARPLQSVAEVVDTAEVEPAGAAGSIDETPQALERPERQAAPARTAVTVPYGVQVGAFSRSAQARTAALLALRRVPELLSGTFVSIPGYQLRTRIIYRALLVGLSRADATTACRRLNRIGQDCIVVGTGSLNVATN